MVQNVSQTYDLGLNGFESVLENSGTQNRQNCPITRDWDGAYACVYVVSCTGERIPVDRSLCSGM